MRVLTKVWYKNYNIRDKYYKEYILNLNSEELKFLILKVDENDFMSIKYLIKRDLNIPIKKLKAVECINGFIDKQENKITLLTNVYVSESYFRTLKIEKILNGE